MLVLVIIKKLITNTSFVSRSNVRKNRRKRQSEIKSFLIYKPISILIDMKKIILSLSIIFSTAMVAQNNQELADKLANPVASMISLPLASSLDVGIGKYDGSRLISNLQPVIPFKVSSSMNLITRTILPIVEQKNVTGLDREQFGISDVNFSAFLSPQDFKKLIWGVGFALNVPTASEKILGSQKWSAGPTALILKQENGFTYGILARQIWSFAGSSDRQNVSQLYMQPFFGYNYPSGAGLIANVESTQDWENSQFTGYLNLVGSMVSTFGKQPVSFGLGPRIPLTKDSPGDWGIRASVTLVFKQ